MEPPLFVLALCVCFFFSIFVFVVSLIFIISAVNGLERLVSETTYCVSSVMLNSVIDVVERELVYAQCFMCTVRLIYIIVIT